MSNPEKLTNEEFANLRSQFVTSSWEGEHTSATVTRKLQY